MRINIITFCFSCPNKSIIGFTAQYLYKTNRAREIEEQKKQKDEEKIRKTKGEEMRSEPTRSTRPMRSMCPHLINTQQEATSRRFKLLCGYT